MPPEMSAWRMLSVPPVPVAEISFHSAAAARRKVTGAAAVPAILMRLPLMARMEIRAESTTSTPACTVQGGAAVHDEVAGDGYGAVGQCPRDVGRRCWGIHKVEVGDEGKVGAVQFTVDALHGKNMGAHAQPAGESAEVHHGGRIAGRARGGFVVCGNEILIVAVGVPAVPGTFGVR